MTAVDALDVREATASEGLLDRVPFPATPVRHNGEAQANAIAREAPQDAKHIVRVVRIV
jgi:hypothetical protein